MLRKVLATVMAAALVAACTAVPFMPRTDASVYLVTERGHGSGVVVAEGVILTAAHVAIHMDTGEAVFEDGARVSLEGSRMARWYGGKAVGPAPDLAVIFADTNGTEPVAVRCEPVKDGEALYAVGNPGVAMFVTTRGYVAQEQGYLVSLNGQQRWDGAFYIADLAIQGGSSGGPVYDGQGRLVGITTATIGGDNDHSLTIVQSPQGICAFLDEVL